MQGKLISDLVRAMQNGETYTNLHTVPFPDGEISKVSFLILVAKSVYPDVKDISVSKDNLAGQPAYRNEHMTWMLDHWQKSVSLFTIKNGKLFEVSIQL